MIRVGIVGDSGNSIDTSSKCNLNMQLIAVISAAGALSSGLGWERKKKSEHYDGEGKLRASFQIDNEVIISSADSLFYK